MTAGPYIPSCDGLCLGGLSDVPVNADNENGSALKTAGIPTTRDFTITTPTAYADQEILTYTVTSNGLPAGGTWDWVLIQNDKGQVRLWKDAKKSATLSVPNGATTFTFSVEGTHESAAAGDITLFFSYTANGTVYDSNTLKITVTPVVNSFTVTPAAGQNINFVDQTPTGLQGLTAQGIVDGTFKFGEVVNADIVNGPRVSMYFVQNLTEVKNGANGSAAGIVYTAASGLANLNYVPDTTQNPPLTFPCLDSLSNKPTDYGDFTTNATPTGVIIQGDDSPRLGGNKNNDKIAIIDFQNSYRVYLVAQFGDGSLYSVGYINWKANFWADTNVPTKGVSVIRDPKGVTADATWTVSNLDPQTNPPTANKGLIWK
jgi:hypothetical protein